MELDHNRDQRDRYDMIRVDVAVLPKVSFCSVCNCFTVVAAREALISHVLMVCE